MKISDRGLDALIAEEGEVLQAYRDVVGVVTIGVGLTAKSGVIVPKMGMTITREENRRLLRLALSRTYEPEVEVAMSIVEGGQVARPVQHEFDAGVGFHFNTGAIGKASWVKLWKRKASTVEIGKAMLQWSKAGGKALPALRSRRMREFTLLIEGQYHGAAQFDASSRLARWGVPVLTAQKAEVIYGLQKLGYVPTSEVEVSLEEVKAFQRDHGLKADGIIGRATLATLQRAIDAKNKAIAPAAATTVSAAASLAGAADLVNAIPAQADTAAFVAAGIWLASHLWSYRDQIFGRLTPALKTGA